MREGATAASFLAGDSQKVFAARVRLATEMDRAISRSVMALAQIRQTG